VYREKRFKNYFIMNRITASFFFLAFGFQISAAGASTNIVESANNFQKDTSNVPLLMQVIGQSRSLALKGCPSAIDLIIRSYNAHIYYEKPNTSFMTLARQASLCK
jgi:hypothetical protein